MAGQRAGDMRRAASYRISSPMLGQVQLAVNEGVTGGGCAGQKDVDLTVLNPSRRPAVLALDPRRYISLFQECR